MEAAGLGIGAVALVSLFKDCVDLFSMISAAQHLGKDAALLNTKLDVEKMILLQWSDRVGLLKAETFDTTFKDSETRQIVLQVLTSIKSLLSEGQALQHEYGLQHFDPSKCSELNSAPTESYEGASAARLSRFLQEFEQLKIDARQKKDVARSSKISNAVKRIRWVIIHKDKFDRLIENLSYFNTSLNALVPVTSASVFNLSKEDLSHVSSIAQLDMIAQVSSEEQPAVKTAAIAAKKALIQTWILQRLWFRWYDDRRINVKDAHFKTLGWALNPPNGYLNWDDLSAWLQKGSGIYWLFGKAGSGKSTLLKYLNGHERTRVLLDKWACGSELILCNYFFYALGRPEQKSQSGLLRSLLYQILEPRPDCIEAALPNMWRETLFSGDKDLQLLSIPSTAELMTILSSLCTVHLVDKKLCFLIDGIDEYEGQDIDAAKFIDEIGSFPNVKVIVSSRPHPGFVATFSTRPQMNLPNLTRGDILSYINDTVASHPYLATLSKIEPNATADIVDQLMGKASGVFLWVVLACRSVVQGCHDYDTIEDLKARVNALPSEIEGLFHQMLANIEPRWREESMKLLNLVYTNQCHRGLDPIPTLGMYLAQEQGLKLTSDPSRTNFDKIPRLRITARCQIMEGRLRSRCCGLLEVQQESGPFGNDQSQSRDSSTTFLPIQKGLFLDSRIVFIHRSLYTFLSIPGIWEQDFMRIGDKPFNSYVVLSSLWLRLSASAAITTLIQRRSIQNALAHIYYGDNSGCSPELTIHNLSKLQFVLGTPESGSLLVKARQCLLHVPTCRRYCDDISLVLAFAVEMGLIRVVQYAFQQTSGLNNLLVRASDHHSSLFDCNDRRSHSTFQYLGSSCKPGNRCAMSHTEHGLLRTVYPLLYHALCRPLLHELSSRGCSLQGFTDSDPSRCMVQCILSRGHNPNEEFSRLKSIKKTTPWREWIRKPNEHHDIYYSITQRTPEIAMAMLQAGADIQGLEPEKLLDLVGQIDEFLQASSDFGANSDLNNRRSWSKVRTAIDNRLHDTLGSQNASKQDRPITCDWKGPFTQIVHQKIVVIMLCYVVIRYVVYDMFVRSSWS